MAAFIPSRRDPEVNERAFAKVREDKTREARAGFDGSWVAHPDLVPVCARDLRRASSATGPTSSTCCATTSHVTADDLLAVDRHARASAPRQGLRGNIRIGIQYLAGLALRQRRRRRSTT